MVIASYDERECYSCGDREGTFCWFIVILSFIALVGSCLFLLGMILQSIYRPYTLTDKEEPNPFLEEEKKNLKTKEEIIDQAMSQNFTNPHSNSNGFDSKKFLTKKDDTMEDFMRNMKNDRDGQRGISNFSSDRNMIPPPKHIDPEEINRIRREGNLVPDSADEENIQPYVINTLASHNVEEEELADEFNYHLEKERSSKDSKFKIAELERVSPPDYFNYNNPSPPRPLSRKSHSRNRGDGGFSAENDDSIFFAPVQGDRQSLSNNSDSRYYSELRNIKKEGSEFKNKFFDKKGNFHY